MTKETSNKKNWKGKVAKQWKRMHAGSSPAQNTSYPEGGSIGMLIVQFMHTYASLVFCFYSIFKNNVVSPTPNLTNFFRVH